MRIGYARVSTQEQDTQAQILALKKAGCERIFQEKTSGSRWDRQELHRLLDQLRKGDVVVVWKEEIVSFVKLGQKTAADAARLFSVHPSTISRLLSASMMTLN